MSDFEQYTHRWVRSDLKGRHREFCECYQCALFHPNKDNNCQRAQRLYEFDVTWDCVTPMWECPDFVEDKKMELWVSRRAIEVVIGAAKGKKVEDAIAKIARAVEDANEDPLGIEH